MKEKSATVVGALAICVAAGLWGLDGVVLTPRLHNLDVAVVVFIFHGLPFVLMNGFFFPQYRQLCRFSAGDFGTLFLVALLGGAVGTLAIVKALFLVNFQNLSIVILLQKLQPVFAISLAVMLLKEKTTGKFLWWAALAIVASYFLTFGPYLPQAGKANLLYAALYSLLAAFSFGSATVFSRKLLLRYDFQPATFFRFGATSLIMLLWLVITKKTGQIFMVTRSDWLIFIIIAFTTGSTAIFIYYFGLRRIKAVVSTICELCFPLSAILLDYLLNENVLTPIQWAAAAVMIGAILKIIFDQKRLTD